MKPSEEVTRAERVAIMVVCGNCSEAKAQEHCDRYPELFGLRDVGAEKQDSLF